MKQLIKDIYDICGLKVTEDYLEEIFDDFIFTKKDLKEIFRLLSPELSDTALTKIADRIVEAYSNGEYWV